MKMVSIDEAGPFYLDGRHGGHNKTYIVVCVEILTYNCHLVPLSQHDMLHLIRALEILQALQGRWPQSS